MNGHSCASAKATSGCSTAATPLISSIVSVNIATCGSGGAGQGATSFWSDSSSCSLRAWMRWRASEVAASR